jgi:hypothetical protein
VWFHTTKSNAILEAILNRMKSIVLEMLREGSSLSPKVLEAIFQAFLKFRQAIVDAMFVQKISNFW